MRPQIDLHVVEEISIGLHLGQVYHALKLPLQKAFNILYIERDACNFQYLRTLDPVKKSGLAV